MLILSRRSGQGVRIGDSISVTVMAIDGQFVRLGFAAPPSYRILRDELWHAVATQNQEAATATGASLAHALAHVMQRP